MSALISVYKPTKDDWYPNFANDLVSVSVYEDSSYGNTHRVCIWGEDDCGREKLYKSEAEAMIAFMAIITPEFVSRKALQADGFVTA